MTSKKKRGIIYQLEDFTKAIAYHHEQEPAFIKAKKVYIHHLNEKLKPEVDGNGNSLAALKSIDKLTQVERID